MVFERKFKKSMKKEIMGEGTIEIEGDYWNNKVNKLTDLSFNINQKDFYVSPVDALTRPVATELSPHCWLCGQEVFLHSQ